MSDTAITPNAGAKPPASPTPPSSSLAPAPVSTPALPPANPTRLDFSAPPPEVKSDMRRVATIGYGLIFLTFGIGGAWAALANIDSAIIANGVVSVESKRQVVQHLEGGIIVEIDVKDGESVKAGDLLFRLDPTSSQSNYAALRGQLDTLQATEARLEAERAQADTVIFPAALLARENEPLVRSVIADQRAQFRDRKASLNGQIDILNSRARQGETEIDGLKREREALDSQLFYIEDELTGIRSLSDKGLVSKPRLAELQREKARLQGLVGRNTADAAKAQNTIGEMKLQIQQLLQKQQEDVAQQMVETRQKISDVTEKLAVSENVLKRVDIRAPRAGVVQNINPRIYTIGAVVKPGDTLLEIVPQNDELIVDAQVAPTDVDRLHDGITGVEVRFTAFHSRTTPLILGELRSVSPDRLVDEATKQPYFQAVVAVAKTDIPEDMKARLRPGMPAEVVIGTGERTVLSYLTRPLVDAVTKSLREK